VDESRYASRLQKGKPGQLSRPLADARTLVWSWTRRGERLLADAGTVVDMNDLQFWRTRKAGWAEETVAALQGHVEDDRLRSFRRAVASQAGEGSVHEDLPVELEGLRRALAVLTDLGELTAKRT
jgi:hypothetical protein